MITQYMQSLANNQAVVATSQFIDRQSELRQIWNQYEAAKEGSTRVVLMSGAVGIGKTRLLDVVAEHVKKDEATVLRGSATEFEGMPPYLPFLEALGQYIRVTPLEQLHKQVAGVGQSLVSILPELTVRLGELPITYSLPPDQIRLRLYEAIGTFLEAISLPRVLVLLLDDLHWADSATLDLLCFIARHHQKVKLLILGTYREYVLGRNPALARVMAELTRQRVLTKISVGPLLAKEIGALAANYLGGPVSSELNELLYVQSEGNPFFAEELILCWLERGALAQKGDQWVAVAPLEHVLPASIVGILRLRFAQLSTDVIDLLRVASIIGRTFELPLLAMVEGQEVEAVEEHLREAERAGLVRGDQSGLFTFNHDMIRACLYTEVSSSRRKRLHQTIGKVLEMRYNQASLKSTALLSELAFHFMHSSDQSRSVLYAEQAAEQALRSSAVKEAMNYYHIALKHLDPNDERRGKFMLDLGKAALLAGDEGEAVNAYQGALECLAQSNEPDAAAQAAYNLGLVQWRLGNLDAARAAFEHALKLLRHRQSAEVVRVLIDLSTVLTIYMHRQAEGMNYAQQALEVADCLGDDALKAGALRAIAGKLYVSGNDMASASQSLERALALAEASNEPSEIAACCFYLVWAYYWMADIGHSYEVSLRGLEFIERCQQPYLLCNAHSWHALLHASRGAWIEAEQAIEHAQPGVNNPVGPIPSAFLHQLKGFLAYQREDYPTAEREFLAARVNHQKGSGQFMFLTGLLGLTQVALKKHEEVLTSISQLETLLIELPEGSLSTAPILICLALLAIALHDQKRARALYPKLLVFRGQHYWFLVDRVLGELATLCEDWKMAKIHLAEAAARAQREELRPELARTIAGQAKLEVARGGQGNTTRATELLNHALRLFQELKLTNAVDSLRQLRSTLASRQHGPLLRTLPVGLTSSEAKVLQLVIQGKSNRQIAQDLGISEKTVANHLSHIFYKTRSDNRAAAAAFAIRHGIG